MQSSERQAGSMPVADSRPMLGLSPTRLLKQAGTRPEPAVSVPRLKQANPLATATAEPELEPPLIMLGSTLFLQAPQGERVPTSPVAN